MSVGIPLTSCTSAWRFRKKKRRFAFSYGAVGRGDCCVCICAAIMHTSLPTFIHS